jgi:hypothetical protein
VLLATACSQHHHGCYQSHSFEGVAAGDKCLLISDEVLAEINAVCKRQVDTCIHVVSVLRIASMYIHVTLTEKQVYYYLLLPD